MIREIMPERLYNYDGLLNLSQLPQIRHAVTDEDTEVLVCQPEVPYPNGNPALQDLLLDRVEVAAGAASDFSGYVLLLPSDYLPLASVLNESFSVMSPRSEDFLRGVFREIGTGLKRALVAGQGVPSRLTYRQIIIQRDSPISNILPPLEMQSATSVRSLDRLGRLLLQDCVDASETTGRISKMRELFEGFWEGADSA